MERLGISIQNADGSIKPFGELIGDLRDKFAITTDAERAQNYAMAEQKLTMEGLADSLSGLSGRAAECTNPHTLKALSLSRI